ncbi:hypothetical protein TWF481_006490 [Arthrobotrys musiformis]|uniref:Uncharacterized protein n=1 Tax=Arthrobotrys musiformis TaxID=47236 RepID=A0AAV9W9L5_9PEZI
MSGSDLMTGRDGLRQGATNGESLPDSFPADILQPKWASAPLIKADPILIPGFGGKRIDKVKQGTASASTVREGLRSYARWAA